MRVAGFVLAGGLSRRMGRDKALLPFAGTTLIERIAGAVLDAAGEVSIVGRPAEYLSLGLPVLDEDFPGCGPLSGIEAALRQMSAEWALITACDMPGVTIAWLRHLIAIAERGDSPAVVTSTSGGQLEPLLAVYHASLQPGIRKALTEGRFAVRDFIAGQSAALVESPCAGLTANLNTPEEWAVWSR